MVPPPSLTDGRVGARRLGGAGGENLDYVNLSYVLAGCQGLTLWDL